MRAENLELRQQAGYWKRLHELAREREEELNREVEQVRAKVKELERQLFGRKSEKGCRNPEAAGKGKGTRKRGQQPGNPGPKRRDTSHLPVSEETSALPEFCPRCGKRHKKFPGTEDSEQIEIEVKAHKRILRRERYEPCDCDDVAGIVTAPAIPKLIPKGRYGTSVWATILLDKYCFQRPTNRLLEDFKTHGIDLAMGTITGGLKRLAPLFEPLMAENVRKNLEEKQWHSDGTGWKVFEDIPGKVGHHWELWLFQSASAVVFILDPTRKAKVPETYFAGVEGGTLIVDRYIAYKVIVQVKEGRIQLAFCWAHVRRDYLGVARDWSGQEEWGLSWVEAIGELYHLNGLRLQAEEPAEFAKRDDALRAAVDRMAQRREEELSDEQLHPARRKALKSLRNHWPGLTLFVDHPEIPMDNNQGERTHRAAVVARKQFYGSHALWSGHLAASMFSLFATLRLARLNPRTWLTAYLEACAVNGGQAPPDAARWLPWNPSAEQRKTFAAVPGINDSS